MEYNSLPSIIGIVGHIRAGKSTAGRYLAENYGYSLTPNARVLRSVLEALNLPLQRDLLAKVGDAIFADLGRDIIARARVAQVQGRQGPRGIRLVIDGIRYREELDIYREIDSFRLLALSAESTTRFKRAENNVNSIKDGALTEDKFNHLSYLQSETNVNELIHSADCIIENNRKIVDLYEGLDKYICNGFSVTE